MFPYLLFIGLAALAMGMLNSLRQFLTPALSPVMLNVMTITAVVLSIQFLSQPIIGVAVGVVLGGMFQFLIQLPGLKKQGMMLELKLHPSHPGVPKIARLAAPVFFSSSVNQFNIFIGTIFASFLATGSISYLFYGMRFIHFPLGIFGIAIATAILPTMSAQAARNETEEFRETLSFGLRLVFFIMFPAMAGLITLRIPIVNLLLEHGQFDRISTQGVAAALLYYAVGLWAMAGVRIVAQAFYALQDTKTPVKIAVLALFCEHRIQRRLHFMDTAASRRSGPCHVTCGDAQYQPAYLAAQKEDRQNGWEEDFYLAPQDRARVPCHGHDRLVGQPAAGLGAWRDTRSLRPSCSSAG